jgi:hypothetical protein
LQISDRFGYSFGKTRNIVTWLVIDVFFWESLLLAIVILPALDRVTATLPP